VFPAFGHLGGANPLAAAASQAIAATQQLTGRRTSRLKIERRFLKGVFLTATIQNAELMNF
jgi:hypothetical protein